MICSGAAFDGMVKLVLFLGFGHKIDLLHHQFETLTPSLLEWRPDLFNPNVRVQSNNLFKLASEYCTWVGFNSRWGSILSIFVFGWGSIRIFLGWGCIQDWGSIRVDTVLTTIQASES